MPLVGFTSDQLLLLGIVSLPVTVDTEKPQMTRVIDFLVVDYALAYNATLGRPALNQLRAVTLTYHLLICFPMEKGIREIKGDQMTARECYMTSLKGEPAPRENMSIDSLEVRDERGPE